MKRFYFGIFSAIILVTLLVNGLHQTNAYDVKCDQTFPSHCFIGSAIDLQNNEELNIAPMDHAHIVTRFEIAPVSNLKNFPKTIFETFPRLEAVTLNSANIKSIAPTTFEKATNLKDLHLKLNRIMKLTKSLFKNADRLEQLDLSGNEISNIEAESFNGLKNLRTLKLNGNRLKVLKTTTFVGLESLEYLHLYSNYLETIEPQALSLPKLTEVFFGNNRLRILPTDLFSEAPNLEVTEFSNNRITHIGDAFIECHNIYSLNLENNPIEDIDLMKFAQMRSLSSLSLNSTSFRFPDVPPTKDNLTITSSSLESLNLGNNNMSNANIFQHLIMFPELQRLYLYNNQFTTFTNAIDIKNALPKLNTLDLIGNCQLLRNNYDIFKRLNINILIPRTK